MATHSSILAWRIPWREEPGKVIVLVCVCVREREREHTGFSTKYSHTMENSVNYN